MRWIICLLMIVSETEQGGENKVFEVSEGSKGEERRS
jgi:hypothetical protein